MFIEGCHGRGQNVAFSRQSGRVWSMFGDLGLTRFPVNDPVNNICCPCMFDAASDSVQAPLFGVLNIAWVTLQA